MSREKEQQIIEMIEPHCAPIYFAKHRNASADEFINNATVAFVDTGERKIFVTAFHVWAKYLEKKEVFSELTLIAGAGQGTPTIILDDVRLIDGDEKYLDLAILEFKNCQYYEQETKKKFFRFEKFEEPELNDSLFFVGFPGKYRRQYDESGAILSEGILFADFVKSVTNNNILSVDEKGDRKYRVYDPNLQILMDLGGISGAPVYLWKNKKVNLVGFVIETSGEKNEIVRVVRADFINRDGSIDRAKIPVSYKKDIQM